jgi:hypothetical protein
MITPFRASQIAKAFGVSLDELFGIVELSTEGRVNRIKNDVDLRSCPVALLSVVVHVAVALPDDINRSPHCIISQIVNHQRAVRPFAELEECRPRLLVLQLSSQQTEIPWHQFWGVWFLLLLPI